MTKTEPKRELDPVPAKNRISPTAGDAGYLDELARRFDQLLDEADDEPAPANNAR